MATSFCLCVLGCGMCRAVRNMSGTGGERKRPDEDTDEGDDSTTSNDDGDRKSKRCRSSSGVESCSSSSIASSVSPTAAMRTRQRVQREVAYGNVKNGEAYRSIDCTV